MQFFTTALLALCAIGQSIATAANSRPSTGNPITIEIPSGFPANGTIVADVGKATDFLQNKVGIDVIKMLAYSQGMSHPQVGVEYPFPAGSGLEESSVTFTQDVAVHGNQDRVQGIDCEACRIICIALSWFPPAFAMCGKYLFMSANRSESYLIHVITDYSLVSARATKGCLPH